MKKTDWDRYYEKPHKIAAVTRRITAGVLVRLMRKYGTAGTMRIMELGGANSCFYDAVKKRIGFAGYGVIDSNSKGLELFRKRMGDDRVTVINEDILAMGKREGEYDLVFSVGLVEHFDAGETAQVIRAHEGLMKDTGFCIITFPTPTCLYRTARKFAELLKVWKFPDERPLTFSEVVSVVEQFGTVLHRSVIWPIILTQGVIVFRKKPAEI